MLKFSTQQYQTAFRLAYDAGNGFTSHMEAVTRLIDLHRDQSGPVLVLAYELAVAQYEHLPFDDPQADWPRSQMEVIERLSRIRQLDKSKQFYRDLCDIYERGLPKYSKHSQFNLH